MLGQISPLQAASGGLPVEMTDFAGYLEARTAARPVGRIRVFSSKTQKLGLFVRLAGERLSGLPPELALFGASAPRDLRWRPPFPMLRLNWLCFPTPIAVPEPKTR